MYLIVSMGALAVVLLLGVAVLLVAAELYFSLQRAWAAWLYTHKRVISNHDDGHDPYLTRWYIFGAPRMPDGSCPFGPDGRVLEGAKWPRGWGLYVHCFHRSDVSMDLHSHPWKWALSWVLKGGYSEERRGWGIEHSGRQVVGRRDVRPGAFNLLRADTFHRVDLYADCPLDACSVSDCSMAKPRPCWSLFLTGPKSTSWGFWNRDTGRFTPWKEYLGVTPEGS